MNDPSNTPTKPRIKVTDRRLFDSEGNYRADVETEAESEGAAAAPPSQAPASDSEGKSPVPASDSGDESAAPASDSAAEPAASASEPEAPAVAPPSDSAAQTAPPKSRWFGKARTTEPASEPDPPAETTPQPEFETVPTDAAPGTPPATRDLPRDLSGLVESQYFEALLYMGAMPHPATGQVMEDLDMAQYKVDLLGMLQTKTEGNRTPEESKVLEDVLYQLRMLYLQKSKVTKL